MPAVNRQSGFTLIELMVVLVLVAIVAGIAIPSMSDLIDRHRVTSVTNSSLGLLNFARSEAIRRGQAVIVTSAGNSMTATLATDGSVVRQNEPAEGGVTITAGQVRFEGSGLTAQALGAETTFRVCGPEAGDQGQQLSVAGGGRTSSVAVNCP